MRPRTLVLCLLLLLGGFALTRDPDRVSAYEIRLQGTLLRQRRYGSSIDARISNPTTRTRKLTIAWQLPSCQDPEISIRIDDHHGQPIYDGRGRCEPFVVPIPAVELVTVTLRGRGDYDLVLALE